MANQFQIITMVGQKALARFINRLGFTKQIDNPYQKEFGRAGAKIGDAYNIRLPVNFVGGNGPTISPEDIVEQVTPLTINAQLNVSFLAYTSEDLLYMDDHMERYMMPAVDTLADKFDRLGLATFNQVYNSIGVPGTTIQSVYTTAGGGPAGQYAVQNLVLNSGALLTNFTAPEDDRTIALNPTQNAGLVGALTNQFNPSDRIGAQWKTARMKQALGFDFAQDQNMPVFTTGGSSTAVTVTGAGQTGNSLIVAGLTGTLNPGDTFTLPLVGSVNPKNYQPIAGQSQQFTLTASVTGTGGANTLPVTPAINPAVGVGQTVSASPANGATLVINAGAAVGTVSPQAMVFHPEAFTWASPALPQIPAGVVSCRVVTDKQTGLSVRVLTAYDPVHDQLITRLDILAGWALKRPQFASRLAS
jgi:hypothetical protein